nr:immunoglobulin light chain junction region [Macaca mulatta]
GYYCSTYAGSGTFIF